MPILERLREWWRSRGDETVAPLESQPSLDPERQVRDVDPEGASARHQSLESTIGPDVKEPEPD